MCSERYPNGQCVDCARGLLPAERKDNGYRCDLCMLERAREQRDWQRGRWMLREHPLDYGQSIQ